MTARTTIGVAAGAGAAAVVVAVAALFGPWRADAPEEAVMAAAGGEEAAATEASAPAEASPAAPAEVSAPEVAADGPAPATEAVAADPVAAPESATVPIDILPEIQDLRVEADGLTVLAGMAAPGAAVAVLLDGVEAARLIADGDGRFAGIVVLPPSEQARSMTLVSDPEGAAVESAQMMVIAPTAAPPAVAAAEEVPGEEAPAEAVAMAATDAPAESVAEAAEPAPGPAPGPAAEEVALAAAVTPEPAPAADAPAGAADPAAQDAQPDPAVAAGEPAATADAPAAAGVAAAAEAALPADDRAADVAIAGPEGAPDQPAAEPAGPVDGGVETAAATGAADPATPAEEPVTDVAAADAVQDAVPDASAAAAEPAAEVATAEPAPTAAEPVEPVEPAAEPVTAEPAPAPAPPPAPAPEVAALAPDLPDPEPVPAAPPPVLMIDDESVRVVQPALVPGAVPEPVETVALDTITYDSDGEVMVSGRASGGGFVRVYVDNVAVAAARIGDDGFWDTTLADVPPGVYTIRIDQMDDAGAVVSRMESPFQREARADVAAAMADTTGADFGGVAVKTVQPGHTLWAIARERYGEGIMYVEVFAANRDRIRNPDLIYPGQVFVLPEVAAPAAE